MVWKHLDIQSFLFVKIKRKGINNKIFLISSIKNLLVHSHIFNYIYFYRYQKYNILNFKAVRKGYNYYTCFSKLNLKYFFNLLWK